MTCVGRFIVVSDGGLIDHSYDGHTQTHTQREHAEETKERHDPEDETAARNVALGIGRHVVSIGIHKRA